MTESLTLTLFRVISIYFYSYLCKLAKFSQPFPKDHNFSFPVTLHDTNFAINPLRISANFKNTSAS